MHGNISLDGRRYKKGMDVPWHSVYPFFLLHAGVFGTAIFVLAYGSIPDHDRLIFLYGFGAIPIAVYVVFYLVIFGLDEVEWLLINGGLGVSGVYNDVGSLLWLFGRRIGDYPARVHVIPFIMFVLYTFLMRHAVLDLSQSRGDKARETVANRVYVGIYFTVSVTAYFFHAATQQGR